MRKSAYYGIHVLTAGLMVLVFFAVPTYFGRYLCDVFLQARSDNRSIYASPSCLLPADVEEDPNVDRRSEVRGWIGRETLLSESGLASYLLSFEPGGSHSDVLYISKEGRMYFDRASGQIVWSGLVRDIAGQPRRSAYYAGPEGFSNTPGKELGRFIGPIVSVSWSRPHIVYDRTLRRFFAIDGKAQTVRSSPELSGSPDETVIAVGRDQARERGSVSWTPPMKRVLREQKPNDSRAQEDSHPQYDSRPTIPYVFGGQSQYVPIIEASGRIDVLNCETLELVKNQGTLPAPATLYGYGSARPRQLLGYDVELVDVGSPSEYVGMVAGSVSRQGTSMTLAVYNKAGKAVRTANTDERREREIGRSAHSSAWSALFGTPWAPTLTICKYLLESVHPLALTVASFFAAEEFEAGESYRTLFFMPNSFVAMHRDLTKEGMIWQFISTFWLLLPAVLLSVFLAWRVSRDATAVGLAGDARSAWVVATIALGLPAYITYRLTRPRIVLVTCRSCGHPRRPDMERCHRCNSLWDVPELNPPAWRVFDGVALAINNPDEKPQMEAEQKTDSSVNIM